MQFKGTQLRSHLLVLCTKALNCSMSSLGREKSSNTSETSKESILVNVQVALDTMNVFKFLHEEGCYHNFPFPDQVPLYSA